MTCIYIYIWIICMCIYIMYVPVYIYISVYIQKKIDETSISWPSLFIWSITSICSDIYI